MQKVRSVSQMQIISCQLSNRKSDDDIQKAAFHTGSRIRRRFFPGLGQPQEICSNLLVLPRLTKNSRSPNALHVYLLLGVCQPLKIVRSKVQIPD